MEIGFIGLGAMGHPIALNLRRGGHQLRFYDVRPQATGELTGDSVSWANNPARAAEGADVVFTCLPGPAEVEAVAVGEHSLIDVMDKGSAWFDLTTNAPQLIRSLHDKFAARGIDVLDAPISGGPKGAASCELAIWVGGDKNIFEKHFRLLGELGGEPTYVGPIGSGCIVKLVHNSASFAVQSTIVEPFTMGVKAGIDPTMLLRALRQGTTGRARTFDRLAEQFMTGIYDPPSFALRLAHKDMNLALALAKECGVPMRMIEIATKDMTEALSRGWGERDARVALTLQEERADVSMKSLSKTKAATVQAI
jgi:3-hydroxyisobutyrate dehydrogenase